MSKRIRLLFVVVFTVLSVGCESFTGGGWIVSKSGAPAKANFGFNLSCTNDGQGGVVVSGSVEYQDKGWLVTGADLMTRTLSLHATLDPLTLTTTCENLDALEQFLFGQSNVYFLSYVPQPPSVGPGGVVLIQPIDNGKAGPDSTDTLNIAVSTGAYSGYTNTGTLQGGNINLALP